MEEREVSYNPDSLPPPRAWKEPSKWLVPVPSEQRIILPTDDRGFIQIDNAFDRVMDLFHPNFEWQYNPDDFRTVPDMHHFYYFEKEWRLWGERLAQSEDPFEHENANAVMDFRGNAMNIGLMLRGIHNALHHTTKKPEMPSLEPIVDFNANYRLASLAFAKVATAADGTAKSIDMRARREQNVLNRSSIADTEDALGLQILDDKYNRRVNFLQQSLHEFISAHNGSVFLPNGEQVIIDSNTSLETIIRIGKIVKSFVAIDFRPR